MQKEHFFLGNQIAEPRSFTPRAKVVPPPVIPERNRQEHAAFIKESYNAVVEYAITALSEREKCGLPSADGVYINLDMSPKLVPQKLAQSSGASILKISEDKSDGNVDVTVYIKNEKKDWLSKKADVKGCSVRGCSGRSIRALRRRSRARSASRSAPSRARTPLRRARPSPRPKRPPGRS